MEYLESVEDKLDAINEENMIYYDIFDYPELVYGTINLASHNVNFSKIPQTLRKSITNEEQLKNMDNLSHSSYGLRLRFHTNAKRIIFKINLKQDYHYDNIPRANSRGFDVYSLDYDRYIHKTTIISENRKDCFAEEIIFEEEDNNICIFLPNFDTINKLFIGIEKGNSIDELPYLGHNKLPIIFCGNEYTIGKTASKSGNSYPNITSQILDQNIINLSYYQMNKAEEKLATFIGKFNCESIIMDYNGQDINKNDFKESYEKFYDKLRIFHPHKQLIILTSLLDDNNEYNPTIYEFYNDKKRNDDKIILIDKKELLKENGIPTDCSNQKNNDEILKVIAEEICNLMKKY
ncbi:MAG: hypothetical protein IJJ47_03755 [Methanosphaera sp.]|nr:hypothetical protein [Methanosphaera sp.]